MPFRDGLLAVIGKPDLLAGIGMQPVLDAWDVFAVLPWNRPELFGIIDTGHSLHFH